MDLLDYPRPANDTGIGIHWVPGYAASVGLGRIREFWLPELKAMGVKWIKIFNHDGALDFCELLLSEGFMPVVRLYRPAPNPGRLGVKELVHLDSLLRLGVRYVEFNNEPDVDAEWKGGRVPVNGLDLVVENTIANLEAILERGGMPALPALSNGSKWDLTGKIVAAGRRDLLDGPVWQAVHNYSRNRPLDYPYDIGNQEGAAFTERFFQALAAEPWGADAWRGRSLADVNRLRYDRRNPNATIADDHACWLAYEHVDALNRKHLGHSLPILSTENGYLVGEDADPRYPATTPDLHMAQTLESVRIMMGTSKRFKAAPDYYFCTAFWLIANEDLGSTSNWWEGHAWYSRSRPNSMLPIVRALQSEPKVARVKNPMPGEMPRVTLRGTVQRAAAGAVLVLERKGKEWARTTLDTSLGFVFPDLLPGAYALRVEGTTFSQPVDLTSESHEVVIALALPEPEPAQSRSVITGVVTGGAGQVVMLLRKSDGEEWVTMARDDGSFRFVDLPPGDYSAQVFPQGTRIDSLLLDGRNQPFVELAYAGWGYTVRTAEDVQKIGAIVVAVAGTVGARVQAHAADWSSETAVTGSAPEYGPYACIITPLEAEHYIVTIDSDRILGDDDRPAQLEARVQVDKRSIPLVEFVFTDIDAPPVREESVIAGRVVGAFSPVDNYHVSLLDGLANRRSLALLADGSFQFDGLAAGLYTVLLEGRSDVPPAAELVVDGVSRIDVELRLPVVQPEALLSADPAVEAPVVAPRGASVLAGHVPEGRGVEVRLVDPVGNEVRTTTDGSGRFQFERLAPGAYELFADGGYVQSDIALDGMYGLEIHFSPLLSVWEAVETNAGSLPGYSAVRVEVEGQKGQKVHLAKEGDADRSAVTGDMPDLGAYTVEFKPLQPGTYIVEPDGLGVWTTVDLTGLESMVVSFRRRVDPISPNQLRTLPPVAQEAEVNGAHTAVPAYLLVAGGLRDEAVIEALLHHVLAQRPVVGRDLNAAALAVEVLVVGDNAAAAEVELARRGAAVRRFEQLLQ
jgi:hypothetical protein